MNVANLKNMTDFLMNLTELGNSLFLAIFSLFFALYLFFLGYRREPMAIVLGFVLPAAIIGVLKVGFYTCQSDVWGIVSPSGHAALSIGVYGTSAFIISKISSRGWYLLIPLSLIVLSIVIAISRTILGMHTDGDVIIGSLIGASVVTMIARLLLSYPRETASNNTQKEFRKQVHPLIMCGLVLTVVVLSYGVHLPSEEVMKSIAKKISVKILTCPR